MRAEFTGKQKRLLAQRLIRERASRLMNCGEMGALLGMDKATVSLIEREKAPLQPSIVKRLIAFNPDLLEGIVHPDVLNSARKSGNGQGG